MKLPKSRHLDRRQVPLRRLVGDGDQHLACRLLGLPARLDRRGSGRARLPIQRFARPPVQGLDFEVDVRGATSCWFAPSNQGNARLAWPEAISGRLPPPSTLLVRDKLWHRINAARTRPKLADKSIAPLVLGERSTTIGAIVGS